MKDGGVTNPISDTFLAVDASTGLSKLRYPPEANPYKIENVIAPPGFVAPNLHNSP